MKLELDEHKKVTMHSTEARKVEGSVAKTQNVAWIDITGSSGDEITLYFDLPQAKALLKAVTALVSEFSKSAEPPKA